MRRETPTPRRPAEVRVRRGYFECRYGQLHVHNSIPPGGGFAEATPLLCLHDWPGSGRVFARFLALAGLDRSAYAPALPGFGESDPPAPVPAIADYAAAIGDFLDNVHLRHVDVLGQRAGALIATELALTRPAQIGRVVMVSAPPLSETERQGAGRGAAPAAGAGEGLRPPDWQRRGTPGAAPEALGGAGGRGGPGGWRGGGAAPTRLAALGHAGSGAVSAARAPGPPHSTAAGATP